MSPIKDEKSPKTATAPTIPANRGNPIKCSFFYLPSPFDQKLFFK